MLKGFFGSKVGMTQHFAQDRSVKPATVVSLGTWYVTQVKTKENDGYEAIQIGTPRKRYESKPFAQEWLKAKKQYFLHLRELPRGAEQDQPKLEVGHKITFDDLALEEGVTVDVTANSKGLGFQGVMRRWGFSGGPGGHGSTFHRAPGSIGSFVFGGEVFKGRKMPGRTGGKRVTTQGLEVVGLIKESGHLLLGGSVPGKKGSLVRVSKQNSSARGSAPVGIQG